MNGIKHRIRGGGVSYNSNGLYIKPFFSSYPKFIAWKDVDFISSSPVVEHKLSAWQTSDGINLMADDSLKKLSGFEIHVILTNRFSFFKEIKFMVLWWAHFFLNLKPLYVEDKPEKSRGVLTLKVKIKSLSCPLRDLLYLFEQKSKFGLLLHD